MIKIKTINTQDLCIAYEESGSPNGVPIVLLHGFPYDVRCYDKVASILSTANCRVIVPYLRGYGFTRFLYKKTPRSGQQAALAHDLLALMDALSIPKAILGGYDWGGRAACITAALWPDRVIRLVTVGGYNIQNISKYMDPKTPEKEMRYWYQYYFHSERGRAGLIKYRKEFCRLIWELWSPTWKFDDSIYEKSAISFTNEDFVEVVIHSYRHRFGLVDGDPRYENTEKKLVNQPTINVPTVVLYGDCDGLSPIESKKDLSFLFSGNYISKIVVGAGHNLPQQKPEEFASAILKLVE